MFVVFVVLDDVVFVRYFLFVVFVVCRSLVVVCCCFVGVC